MIIIIIILYIYLFKIVQIYILNRYYGDPGMDAIMKTLGVLGVCGTWLCFFEGCFCIAKTLQYGDALVPAPEPQHVVKSNLEIDLSNFFKLLNSNVENSNSSNLETLQQIYEADWEANGSCFDCGRLLDWRLVERDESVWLDVFQGIWICKKCAQHHNPKGFKKNES